MQDERPLQGGMPMRLLRQAKGGERACGYGQEHHVLALAFIRGAIFPSEITILAGFENFAKARDREFGSLRIDEMKFSSTTLFGEKCRGLLRDLAFLPKDLILLAQPRELLADIRMRTFEQIGLLVFGSPAPSNTNRPKG